MTDLPNGPGVFLKGVFIGPTQCKKLSEALSRTIRIAHGEPGKPEAEQIVLDLAAQISAVTGVSANHGVNTQARPNADMPDVRSGSSLPFSDLSADRLKTEDAAKIAGMSARNLRRLIDKRVLTATRDQRGAYLVDLPSLIAYVSQRRSENSNRKAA